MQCVITMVIDEEGFVFGGLLVLGWLLCVYNITSAHSDRARVAGELRTRQDDSMGVANYCEVHEPQGRVP
jgi:hypothetical protein